MGTRVHTKWLFRKGNNKTTTIIWSPHNSVCKSIHVLTIDEPPVTVASLGRMQKNSRLKLWYFCSAECGFECRDTNVLKSKTLNHFCCVLSIRCKAVGPICCACSITQYTNIIKRRGSPGCSWWAAYWANAMSTFWTSAKFLHGLYNTATNLLHLRSEERTRGHSLKLNKTYAQLDVREILLLQQSGRLIERATGESGFCSICKLLQEQTRQPLEKSTILIWHWSTNGMNRINASD